MKRDVISVSLWVYNLGYKLSSMEEWLGILAQGMEQALQHGSELLVLPELACEHWLTFAPDSVSLTEEVAWMAAQAQGVLPRIQALVDEAGLSVLAGTMPAASDGGFNNRAFLFRPGCSSPVAQNKLCLTPDEKDPNGWDMKPGSQIRIIDYDGVQVAIVICLDVELPALSAYLAKHAPKLDLLLVPSMTEKLSGYSRVFGCAKARAIELQAVVCVVGTMGTTVTNPPKTNISGASVFLPCEELLGNTGVFQTLAPSASGTGLGPILHARDIPVGQVRHIRENLAEVWPGAFSSAHLTHGAVLPE